MKKFLFIVLALAVALSFGAPAMAKQGLSVGLSFGLLPNAGGLGSAIATDGLDKNIDVDGAANATGYDTLTLIPSEKAMLDDETSGLLKDVETNGAMTALDLGLVVRYDMLKFLFVQTGFSYTFKAMGGNSSFKWVTPNAAGKDENTYVWDYRSWQIPFTVGINLPLMEGKLNLYMGLSAAYMKGYWECDVEISKVSSTIGAAATGVNGAIVGLDAGTAKDTPKFEHSGIGMGYLLGVDAEIMDNLSLFIEYQALAAVGYDEYKIKDAGFKAAGITHFNYPSLLGGSFLKFGAKYNLGFSYL
jgi:opacity protein-like surface antigen